VPPISPAPIIPIFILHYFRAVRPRYKRIKWK
jgi:hypothetical protein